MLESAGETTLVMASSDGEALPSEESGVCFRLRSSIKKSLEYRGNISKFA